MLRSLLDSPTDERSVPLVTRLREKGLHARLVASEYCGERDVRIRVRRSLLGHAVELLCDATGEPEPAHWHAVRGTGNQRRVWRGPVSGGGPDEVLTFVEDLLLLDDAALAGRYLPLG